MKAMLQRMDTVAYVFTYVSWSYFSAGYLAYPQFHYGNMHMREQGYIAV